jgi:hypothetical protein
MHPLMAKARFDTDLAGVTGELCEMRRWTVFEREYPIFDLGFYSAAGAKLRIRMECENWNEQPPAVVLQDWVGVHLRTAPASSTNIFNAGPHRNTGRPFVCMRGTREYHTHESHISDPWDSLSGLADYRLGEIATQIWNAWRKVNL